MDEEVKQIEQYFNSFPPRLLSPIREEIDDQQTSLVS